MIDGVRANFQVPDPAHPGKKLLASHAVDIPLIGPHVMSAHELILGLGFVFAVLAALVTLMLRRDFEHRGQEDAPQVKKTNPFAAMRDVLSDKLFWRFMLMLALLSLVRMMFQHMHFTWPKYITRMEGEQFPVGTVWSINSPRAVPRCACSTSPAGSRRTALPPMNRLALTKCTGPPRLPRASPPSSSAPQW